MKTLKNHLMYTVNDGINFARTSKGAELVDIRPKDIYKKGHVAGSVNIPMDNPEVIKLRIRDVETPLYIYGDFNHNPRKAAKLFKKMGYKNITLCGYIEEHVGNSMLKKK